MSSDIQKISLMNFYLLCLRKNSVSLFYTHRKTFLKKDTIPGPTNYFYVTPAENSLIRNKEIILI